MSLSTQDCLRSSLHQDGTIEENMVFETSALERASSQREIDEKDRFSTAGNVIFRPIHTSLGAIKWVGGKLEDNLVTPVASRLSHSILNPVNLSSVLWNRIKDMTPQRARDVSRIFSTAIANSVEVLHSKESKELMEENNRFQKNVAKAAASKMGREFVINFIGTVAKLAQAMNTPEMKSTTDQAIETAHSFIDLLASREGKDAIKSSIKSVSKLCEVAASPETAIFLTEVTTNICHALEIENRKWERERKKENKAASNTAQDENLSDMESTQSPSDDESIMSDDSSYAERCMRIEKTVLERLGIERPMLEIYELRVQEKMGVRAPGEQETEETADVVIPRWNNDEVRSTLRQRHAREVFTSTEDTNLEEEQRESTRRISDAQIRRLHTMADGKQTRVDDFIILLISRLIAVVIILLLWAFVVYIFQRFIYSLYI